LLCSSCNYSSEGSSTFINISIDIPDNFELESTTNNNNNNNEPDYVADATSNLNSIFFELTDLLKTQMQPEVLDEDNKWECGKCKEKVQASKFQKYEKLPKTLMIHLKRFRFDPVS
jgi:ubiquitin C-terminal hydrolase